MEYDCLIVGGGASGLFCAAEAAANGARTLVLERRERPARKLMITGKGRCNLTNDCSPEDFLKNVVRGGRFLYSAAYTFTAQDTMRWFEAHGAALKVERGARVFPQSDSARDVVDTLLRAARAAGAEVQHARVDGLLLENGAVRGVRANGRAYHARAVVIATGGLSYPATGSDGDGYRFAAAAGHTVLPPAPALIALDTREPFVRELAGLALRNVTLSLWDEKRPKKPLYSELGEMLFTHTGVSGPLALTASSYIEPARATHYHLTIDLKPGLAREALDRRILRDFEAYKNKTFQNALTDLLPRSLIPAVILLCGIPEETRVHSITRDQRAALLDTLKAFPLHVRALGPIEEAIITRGGVKTAEIDPKTMRSKLCGGLYFTGEVLDADALTGGFNLQIAFSTASLAAQAIAEALPERHEASREP